MILKNVHLNKKHGMETTEWLLFFNSWHDICAIENFNLQKPKILNERYGKLEYSEWNSYFECLQIPAFSFFHSISPQSSTDLSSIS